MHLKKFSTDKWKWVDIVDPSQDELFEIGEEYSLPQNLIEDCMEPEHLPKFQRSGALSFVILRAVDENAHKEADSVQELTRKIALFYREGLLLTIHRTQQPYIDAGFQILETEEKDPEEGEKTQAQALFLVIENILGTYDRAIELLFEQIEKYESEVFHANRKVNLHKGYLIKRKAAVLKQMLRLFLMPLSNLPSDFQSLRERTEKLLFLLEDVQENMAALVSIHISLVSQKTNEASHRTNETVRVLTILSVFFIPLNFISGFFGMNFESMPWIHDPHGTAYSGLLMLGVILCIYLFFRLKGWMKGF
jgi:magnesium transporter